MQPASLMPELAVQPVGSSLFARLTAWRNRQGSAGIVGQAALAAFAIRVLSAAIAYLSQVVLARWMGSTEYGIFVWVWVWVLILGGLSSLGLQLSVIRYVPQYLALQQMDLLAGVRQALSYTARGSINCCGTCSMKCRRTLSAS